MTGAKKSVMRRWVTSTGVEESMGLGPQVAAAPGHGPDGGGAHHLPYAGVERAVPRGAEQPHRCTREGGGRRQFNASDQISALTGTDSKCKCP